MAKTRPVDPLTPGSSGRLGPFPGAGEGQAAQSAAMILVTNRLPVAPGFEAQFELRFSDRARQIEHEPGFVRLCVLRPAPPSEEGKERPPYLVQTWWNSEADFRAWTRSESFRAAHSHPPTPGMYTGRPVMEIHEEV